MIDELSMLLRAPIFVGQLLIIAGDFHVELPKDVQGLTGELAKGQPRTEDMMHRTSMLSDPMT